jgi:hypothetical protein
MNKTEPVVKLDYIFEQTSGEKIKKDVKAYFESRHGQSVDYVELLEHFEYSLPEIVTACAELEKEGKIVGLDQIPGK